MSTVTREAVTASFKAKNARRIEGRKNGPARRRQDARVLRRQTGGAFGRMTVDNFNERLPGTTGANRVKDTRKRED